MAYPTGQPTADASPPHGAIRRRPSSSRGAWTIFAIFLVGGAVVTGLFLAPKTTSPPAPPGMPSGVPDRPLRAVLFDLAQGPRDVAAVIASVRGATPAPDFVLLAGVSADEVAEIAAALEMTRSYHPQLYQRTTTGEGDDDAATGGTCVLSRHPLYEGRSLRASKKVRFGTAAVAVVDGWTFRLACVRYPKAGTPARADADRVVRAFLAEAPSAPSVLCAVGADPADAPPGFDATGTPGGAFFVKGWEPKEDAKGEKASGGVSVTLAPSRRATPATSAARNVP